MLQQQLEAGAVLLHDLGAVLRTGVVCGLGRRALRSENTIRPFFANCGFAIGLFMASCRFPTCCGWLPSASMIQIWGELPRLETKMIRPSGVHEGMDPDPGSTTLPVPSSRTVNSCPSAPLITRRLCCAVGGGGGGGLEPEQPASVSARRMMMIFISMPSSRRNRSPAGRRKQEARCLSGTGTPPPSRRRRSAHCVLPR